MCAVQFLLLPQNSLVRDGVCGVGHESSNLASTGPKFKPRTTKKKQTNKNTYEPSTVVLACNPSFLGDRNQDHGSRPALATGETKGRRIKVRGWSWAKSETLAEKQPKKQGNWRCGSSDKALDEQVQALNSNPSTAKKTSC
jgi:hypothetical protein